ncbi:HFR010Cp [Eremothecium sinecaudum]|uniref:HFR010Cp n=1 Tax=Eremothecium sinecaudum TaxID=45286 RepID=A0A0X8HUS5_9SACH|nr:HFR010Cp [Eremothecium sinecaudum]AMD21865.1 HFR010Cp [Eremothecium sinecaudum]
MFKLSSFGSTTKLAARSLTNCTFRAIPRPLSHRQFRLTEVLSKRYSSLRLKSLPYMQKRPFSSSVVSKQILKTGSNKKPRTLINSSRNVGLWLIGTSGLVFGIVVLGGLTRLTESGLSITEWKPVTGAIPPLNEVEWELEFLKYKESPEFKQLNSHLTLDEFKFIFFMEWAHRLWGRAIGLLFVLPASYFFLTRKTSPRVNRRVFGLACLLGFQGFIGWWMVKSGLDQEQLDERKSKPTVSQYRLTAHLGTAFVLYLGMLWTGFEILREAKWIKSPSEAIKLFSKLENPALRPLRKYSTALLALTFITAMTGGLVAGLDAGLIYNTFPHMGEDLLPSKRELMDETFARRDDKKDLIWRNLLENPATVQLSHRIFATSTFFSVLALHFYCNRRKTILPTNAKRTMHALMGLVTMQVALGITTLIYLVPVSLASAHQAGALMLLTGSLLFAAQVRKPRNQIRVLVHTLSAEQYKPKSKVLSEVAKIAKC